MSNPTMDVIVDAEPAGSYVDWPAIIGGIVLASAISLLLLTFGAALGLSFVDFRPGGPMPSAGMAFVAAIWLLLVQVTSFMAGAYLTGRLRRRRGDASEHEIDVRDGAHGLLVWAGALVLGGLIAAGGLSALAGAAGSAAATLTNAAATVADDAQGPLDPNAYFADALFRPGPNAAAPTGDTTAVRGEASRILAQAAVTGSVDEADRAYLASVVAANTGLPPEEASARVTQVLTEVDQARAQAAQAAEALRRATVLGAFTTAAAILVSAAAAYWAAQKGGNHRDQGTAFPRMFRRT